MADQPPDFLKGIPVQFNKYDPLTQNTVPGFNYPVHDNVSGGNFIVFVPASAHGVEQTNQIIEAFLAPVRANVSNLPPAS